MPIESLIPTSRDHWLDIRKSTIGASEIAALLGEHPWLTPFKLFAKKTGQYKEEDDAGTTILENSVHLPPLARGNFMESKAFEAMQMLRPDWTVTPNQIPGGYIFIDREFGLSSTPDAFLTAPDRQGRGALQIKTVAPMIFDKDWKNDAGEIEFPLYVVVQAIVDATLSGCEWARAGALVNNFGIDFYLMDVPLTAGLMVRIRTEATDLWRRVRENNPYPPDYARDGDMITSIYAEDDGGTIDLSGNQLVFKLVARREALKRVEAASIAALKERKTIDAELTYMLGNAARGTLSNGMIIEAKTVRKRGFTVAPTSYRAVKIKQGTNHDRH